MSRGLLDWPALLLDGVARAGLDALPAPLALALWSVLAGIVGVALYARASNQAALAALVERIAVAQKEMTASEAEAELAVVLAQSRTLLALNLRRLAATLTPALLSALPMLVLLPWLDRHYAARFPDEGAAWAIAVAPAELRGSVAVVGHDGVPDSASAATWHAAPPPILRVSSDDHNTVDLAVIAPVAEIAACHWSDVLIANPNGCLPVGTGLTRIDLGFAPRDYLPFGPPWLRGWLAWFLCWSLAAGLAWRRRLGLH